MKNAWAHRYWFFSQYLPTVIFITSFCFAIVGTWWLDVNLRNKFGSAVIANNEPFFSTAVSFLFFVGTILIGALTSNLMRLQFKWREHTREQLASAVRDNSALLSTLNLHAIVSVTDAKGTILEVNDAFCRMSGYSREELVGKNQRMNHSGEHPRQFWMMMWETISNGTPWRGEVCNRAKDGSLYWVDTFIAPFKNSGNVIEKYVDIRIDITKSKHAAGQLQKALRDSDALLSALNMHAIVSIADSAGHLTDVNQAFCRISGYTRDELIDGSHRLVEPGIQSSDFLSNMWRTISSGTPWRGEVCNRTKDGALYWVDTFIAPFKDAQGQIEKFISIRTDITNSKKAASRLASQRSALANIIEGTNVGTWEWNVQTGEMRVNERWAEQVGFELNELLPIRIQTWDELTHPDDLIKAKSLMEHHFHHDSPYYECETRLRHKDKSWIWVLTRGRVSSFNAQGKPEWVAGTQMDITERKNAEAEIQRSTQLLLSVRDQLTKAAEVAELGIWSWDLRTNSLIYNQRMFELYEVPEELRQSNLFYHFWRSKLHPDDVNEVETHLNGTVRGSHSFTPVFRIIRNNKEVRYIQSAGLVERDSDGRAVLVTGINRDITLQFQSEEALRQAKQAADDANQAKSAFLANMSHEIRTPMNAILGMLSLLKRTPLSVQQADYTQKTEGAARSLLSLLNDILDISKVESGKMNLDKHPFQLANLLRDLSVILTVNEVEKPVDVVFEVDPKIPNALEGDELRLRQILTNLGSNAIKFTAQGRVTLQLKLIDINDQKITVQFSVSDTGIGIAPENHNRIFSGFTQAEASTTRRYGGTGLGISISHALVSMMGGELKLESELGKGARFFFTLNLQRAPEESVIQAVVTESKNSSAAPAKPILRLDTMRILLVEDNLNNQQIARELLESEGATIQIAAHGLEAFNAIAGENRPFHLVLMDLQMPVMDGFTATKKIRQELGRSHLPIIAMTANAMESDKEECIRAGFNDHIGKPFDINDLVNRILKHTSGSAAVREGDKNEPKFISDSVKKVAQLCEVDITSALKRLGGKRELYQRMLQMFIHDLDEAVPNLRKASTKNDMSTVLRHIHTIKGLSATLGAMSLSTSLAQIENELNVERNAKGRHDQIEHACSLMQEAHVHLEKLSTELLHDERINALPKEFDDTPFDPELLRSSLIALKEQLEHADMAATETMTKIHEKFAPHNEVPLQALEKAVSALDFKLAQQHCNALLEKIKS